MYLTKRQREILNFTISFIKNNGFSPSLEEIGAGVGLSSIATVYQHLVNLEKKGCIKRKWNRSRSLELGESAFQSLSNEIPLLGLVSAGKPIEAVENPESISISPGFTSKNKTFALKVIGDSMVDEHIRNGDYVIVEERKSAKDGETVVALIDNNEVTIKKFYHKKNKIHLEPANVNMKPIIVDEKNVQIQGVVIGLMRKY